MIPPLISKEQNRKESFFNETDAVRFMKERIKTEHKTKLN